MKQLINKILGGSQKGLVGETIDSIKDIIDELNLSKEEREKIRLELVRMYMDDLKNARQLQEQAYKQDDVFSKRFLQYFSVLVFVLTVMLWYIMLFVKMPPEKEKIIYSLVGASTTVLVQVITFWFGSSMGSKMKDTELLNRLKEYIVDKKTDKKADKKTDKNDMQKTQGRIIND